MSSRAHATIVESIVTDSYIFGEITIKETRIRIIENPDSTENVTTVGKGAISMLIFWLRINRNKMPLTTSLWWPHSM